MNRKRTRTRSRLRTRSKSRTRVVRRTRSRYNPNKRSRSRSRSHLQMQSTKDTGTRYDIHDNGGRPFRVYIDKNQAKIYKSVMDDNLKDHYPNLTKTIKFDKSFIGKPKGNSILLKVGKKYIYIGTSVYEFTPKAEIVKYVSPIGNSDVPYPYAVDTKGNYYLLTEHVILDHIEGSKPYDYYYNERPKKIKLVSKTLVKGY
jgi:hypothetical protein